jgi:pimeloyl-ACP methyl ester carboxylesterase
MNFRRGFVQSGSLRVHYRTAGHGPPVVMLHPSPLSSQAVLPVATAIAGERQVFALDTPGYGLSEPLPARPASLDPYLPVIDGVLDALGIARCCLYGAATGAQLALEYASRYPRRVSLLVMDAAGHIEPEDCDRLVQGYFPDVAPRADGGHLATLWGLVRDLGVFFPWNDPRPAARIEKDLPPATFMQAMLLDYLRAGTRYDWAYRPAFHNERAERVRRCTVPGVLTRWPGSIALSITDALIEEGLPDSFRVLHLGPTLAERARGIAKAIAEGPADPAATLPVRDAAAGNGFTSALLPAGAGQLHARISNAGSGRPLLALHRAGASGRQMERWLAPLAGKRPVIALDLPDHGDNEAIDLPYADWVDLLHQAVCSLGLEQADLLGDGLGGHLAGRLHASQPRHYPQVALVSRHLPRSQDVAWPVLTPSLDGSHLFCGWYLLRDRRLWWPWDRRSAQAIRRVAENLGAQSLHEDWTDLMKCGERFAPLAATEAATDPWAAQQPSQDSVLYSDTPAGIARVGPGPSAAVAGPWGPVEKALGLGA